MKTLMEIKVREDETAYILTVYGTSNPIKGNMENKPTHYVFPNIAELKPFVSEMLGKYPEFTY